MLDRPLGPDGGYAIEPQTGGRWLTAGARVATLAGLAAFFVFPFVYTDAGFPGAVLHFTAQNAAVQFVVFVVLGCVPCLLTERLSYVDVAWAWGLFAIGLQAGLCGTAPPLRRWLIAVEYMLNGSRMGLMCLMFWQLLAKEFTRYQYRRKEWEERPFLFGLIRSTRASMQVEIWEQWSWNLTFLCIPAVLLAFDTEPGLSWVEVAGHVVWATSQLLEFTSDAQKLKFVNRMKGEGTKVRRQEMGARHCSEGLWRYSRHPNYFFQWMNWNGMLIASVPTLLRLQASESAVVWATLAFVLAWESVGMYYVMVWYTGCVPAEAYTVQTRPSYAQYQRETNMFFPGPWRAVGAKSD